MTRATALPIVRVEHGAVRTDQDLVVREAPLSIDLTSAERVVSVGVLMRTPGDDRDLVYGWLWTEGIIRTLSDVIALDLGDGSAEGSTATVALGQAVELETLLNRRSLTPTSACGLCGRLSVEGLDARPRPTAGPTVWSAALLAGLPASLTAAQTVFAETGGLHAAGLVARDGTLALVREDVGRHNAVDKVVGAALVTGRLGDCPLLVVSGRVAFEIVQKAAMAGLSAIVAVGAPTDTAIAAARETGLTLIGFARADRFNVYTGADRICEIAASTAETGANRPQ